MHMHQPTQTTFLPRHSTRDWYSDAVGFQQVDPAQRARGLVCLYEPFAPGIDEGNEDTLSTEADMVDDED